MRTKNYNAVMIDDWLECTVQLCRVSHVTHERPPPNCVVEPHNLREAATMHYLVSQETQVDVYHSFWSLQYLPRDPGKE